MVEAVDPDDAGLDVVLARLESVGERRRQLGELVDDQVDVEQLVAPRGLDPERDMTVVQVPFPAMEAALRESEARLRAGLSQARMAEASGRDQAVIARWEQGAVAPSLDTLIELVRSCGFDIPLELVPYDPEPDRQVAELQLLSPERRVDRLLGRLDGREA